jgi:hypothetical protein
MRKILALLALTAFFAASCSYYLPVAATSNPIPVGEAGILKAARNGGIGKISTVDSKLVMYLGPALASYTTIVTGD